MTLETINTLFSKYKETQLQHRYITNTHIEPLLKKINKTAHIKIVGQSVLKRPIYGLKVGCGEKRILMWSQMHGNESTTTKALFDLLNTLINPEADCNYILQACTLYIIPVLNPDGALAYTRINANEIDLNRDAQDLTQPESIVLRDVFKSFKPHFCYNLHGQRTIFSAGKINKSAVVSFLAPAQDKACTVTPNRKIAMEVIGFMNRTLQQVIPDQVGVYDDAFNLNCVGDTFQSENVPTILFEAGHYPNDYGREVTRKLIYMSYLTSLDYVSKKEVTGNEFEAYFNIPENSKCFLDIIIREAKVGGKLVDIGIRYKEVLVDNKIEFIPVIDKIETLSAFYGHKEIQANRAEVLSAESKILHLGYENDFVVMNGRKLFLFVK